MDKVVSRRKFEAEIRSLQNEAAPYVSIKGWRLTSVVYPTLAVVLRHVRSHREIEFRFVCDNWDECPPSLTLHDPEDGRELSWEEWPKNIWSVLDSHPSTGKPFLCLPGIREYHTHPSHLNDKWDGYRLKGMHRLRDIVDRVHQRFNDSNG